MSTLSHAMQRGSLRRPAVWIVALGVACGAMTLGPRAEAQTAPVSASSSPAPSNPPVTGPTVTFGLGTTLEMLRAQDVVIGLEATDGSSVRTGYAATIVRRPIARILATIHDVNHYRDFIPQFEQSQELAHGNGTQDLFVRVAVRPFTHLWARLRYHDTQSDDGTVSIDGHAMQGNVERMDVRWRATPIDGGAATVLEFWSLVLPSLPLPIPDAVLDGEQESAARRGVEAVRAHVEGEPVAQATSAMRE